MRIWKRQRISGLCWKAEVSMLVATTSSMVHRHAVDLGYNDLVADCGILGVSRILRTGPSQGSCWILMWRLWTILWCVKKSIQGPVWLHIVNFRWDWFLLKGSPMKHASIKRLQHNPRLKYSKRATTLTSVWQRQWVSLTRICSHEEKHVHLQWLNKQDC